MYIYIMLVRHTFDLSFMLNIYDLSSNNILHSLYVIHLYSMLYVFCYIHLQYIHLHLIGLTCHISI